ncbi:MAG: hypothetical protein ACRDF7_04430 [Candidatus Limnocylindrales bacterium]
MSTALILSVMLAGPSLVYATCNPLRTNQVNSGFAGTLHSPGSTPGGVKATIDEYSPFVVSGSQVYAWVMLQTGGQFWAQVGWEQTNGVHSVFYQVIADSGTLIQNNFPGHAIGTHTVYKQLYDPATKTFTMYDASNLLLSTTQNWVPDQIQIFGETHRRSDQMPGGTGAHVKFLDTYEKLGTTWFSLTSPAVTQFAGLPTNLYGATRVSSVDYEIWDKGCGT